MKEGSKKPVKLDKYQVNVLRRNKNEKKMSSFKSNKNIRNKEDT